MPKIVMMFDCEQCVARFSSLHQCIAHENQHRRTTADKSIETELRMHQFGDLNGSIDDQLIEKKPPFILQDIIKNEQSPSYMQDELKSRKPTAFNQTRVLGKKLMTTCQTDLRISSFEINRKFTVQDFTATIEFIDEVRRKECLWRPECSDYQDLKSRDIAWCKIAQQFSVSVNDCKKRWRSLRDQYVKKRQTNGRYMYFKHMSFLEDVLQNNSNGFDLDAHGIPPNDEENNEPASTSNNSLISYKKEIE